MNVPHAPFTKTTKFNDLPDEIKKMFENIEYVETHCLICIFLNTIW